MKERNTEIIEKVKAGVPQTQIAKEYQISVSRVGQIVRRAERQVREAELLENLSGIPIRIARICLRYGIFNKDDLMSRLSEGWNVRGIGSKGAAELEKVTGRRLEFVQRGCLKFTEEES